MALWITPSWHLDIGILNRFLFPVQSNTLFTMQAIWECVPINDLGGTVKSLHILKSRRKLELQEHQHITFSLHQQICHPHYYFFPVVSCIAFFSSLLMCLFFKTTCNFFSFLKAGIACFIACCWEFKKYRVKSQASNSHLVTFTQQHCFYTASMLLAFQESQRRQ